MSMGTGTRVNWKYIHMSVLLFIGFIFSLLLLNFAYLVGLTLSKHIFAFMVIEVTINNLYLLIKLLIINFLFIVFDVSWKYCPYISSTLYSTFSS